MLCPLIQVSRALGMLCHVRNMAWPVRPFHGCQGLPQSKLTHYPSTIVPYKRRLFMAFSSFFARSRRCGRSRPTARRCDQSATFWPNSVLIMTLLTVDPGAGPGSPIPILTTLPLHRDAPGIADLDPHRTRTGPSTFFETIPSAPSRQACAKTNGGSCRPSRRLFVGLAVGLLGHGGRMTLGPGPPTRAGAA